LVIVKKTIQLLVKLAVSGYFYFLEDIFLKVKSKSSILVSLLKANANISPLKNIFSVISVILSKISFFEPPPQN